MITRIVYYTSHTKQNQLIRVIRLISGHHSALAVGLILSSQKSFSKYL